MSTPTESDGRVTMICPNLTCRRTLSAPSSARGKIMRCAYCNVLFRVPEGARRESNVTAGAGAGKKE